MGFVQRGSGDKPLVIPKRLNKIKEGSRAATILIYVAACAVCVATIYPFYYVVIQSIADPREVIAGTAMIWPRKYFFGSYSMILSDPRMWRAYGYTILYVVSGAVLNMLMAVLGAYPLSVKGLFARNFIVRYLVFTMYFSGGLIPIFLLVVKLGLYNNIYSMIVPGMVNVFFIILVRTFMMTIPDELSESASIDGAGHGRILFSIILPLSKPVLAVIAIYAIVGIWNSWFNALVYLPNPNLHPLQFYLYRVMIEQSVDLTKMTNTLSLEDALQKMLKSYQLKYALITFTTLPIIFVYPFFQKYFIKGVMLGSLKG